MLIISLAALKRNPSLYICRRSHQTRRRSVRSPSRSLHGFASEGANTLIVEARVMAILVVAACPAISTWRELFRCSTNSLFNSLRFLPSSVVCFEVSRDYLRYAAQRVASGSKCVWSSFLCLVPRKRYTFLLCSCGWQGY